MTKISNDTVYIVDTDISDLDSLIGTDGNSTARRTKNFLLGQFRTYLRSGLSPLTGGVLRFTEITYSGGLYATHAAVLNNLDPLFVIDQYHVVVVNLNGEKSILKLQNRSVGIDLPLVLTTDFIYLGNADTSKEESIIIPISDLESNLTVGTTKAYFPMPFSATINSVKAKLLIAQTDGALLTFDINENGTSILSTKLTIDNNEDTSLTASIPSVISNNTLTIDSEITFDIDQVGTAGAKGAVITLIVTRV